MQWVADLKTKIKAFVNGHAQELGISKDGSKSQLMSIFMHGTSSQNGPADEDAYERLNQMQKTLVAM